MKLSADSQFHRRVIFLNGLLPLLLMLADAWRGKLGANPVEFVTRATGVMALVFLVLTLLVTPLRKWLGWNWLLKQRRQIGLYAFFYGVLHLMTYLGGDRDWALGTVAEDVAKRPFIAVGMATFLLMVPLAVTSTNAMIRRMGGKAWNRLHRLTYLIAIGGVVHYAMIVKSDLTWPLIFGAAVAALLAFRAWGAVRPKPIKPSPVRN